ncbi:hypothetical protein O7606_26320 [Micromonospora sp. WMMD882]|uniref:hypothetical protein n=1 Tax=Micromonospora sp. WMMD882 TaxID=3015151 RepID=UPI00248CAD9B|nr:hypothetical protein [Micromonospora sp. WMMD882]WBB79618.1 hypothetical protein O7606_26320 [Micromonospora sp. WMMD882]
MNLARVTSAIVMCAVLTTLAACGGEDAADPAGSSSTTSSAPSSAATTASSAPSASTAGASDKDLCESAKKAGDEMKAELVKAVSSGSEPTPAVFQKILTDLEKAVTGLAATGGDSPVATALKQFGVEAAKAASEADPAAAADNPAFEKAGADITAACRAAGVDVNF